MEKFLEIAKEFYLLKSDEKDFHRNMYLKKFIGTKGEKVNLLMDPGTRLDMPKLVKALEHLIGGVQNLDLIFLSHQDPDLTSNLPALLASAPKAIILASMDTWRLIKMYGIAENRFKAVEEFRSQVLKIKKTGHTIQIIPVPYCHFRGSIMLYDYESRVLFSGDLMAGVNAKNGKEIFATEEAWEGISLFHQIYMPSTIALREALGRIAMLQPPPEVIAPQHGQVIKGELVMEFLMRMSELEVGVELFVKKGPEKDQVLLALNEFFDSLERAYPHIHSNLMEKMRSSGNFTSPFIFSGPHLVDIKVGSEDVVRYVWENLKRVAGEETLAGLKALLFNALQQYNLPLPDYEKSPEKAEKTSFSLLED